MSAETRRVTIGKAIWGGYFDSLDAASLAAKEKRLELFTNSPEDLNGELS